MALPEITGRAVPLAALSIAEFCYAHGISRATFYNLIAAGEGPELLRVRRRVLITPAAAVRWRKRHTRPAGKPAPVVGHREEQEPQVGP